MRSSLCPALVCACAFMAAAPNHTRAQNCTPLQSPPQALAPCSATQRQVEVADLDGDQVPDLAVTTNNSLKIELGSLDAAGVPTYRPSGSYRTPTGATGIAIADFNSDGIVDIAVAIETGGLLVFRGLGTAGVANGSFEQYLSIFSDSLWEVHAVDLNGDGILDLAVATGDVNGDGLTDVVVSHTHGSDGTTFSAFINTFGNFVPGDGFPIFSENPVGGFNWGDGITLANVNLDGGVDVLVAGITSNSLQVFVTHRGAPPIQLWTLMFGQGVVQRSPDMSSYPAGNSVVLTAVRTIGSRFDGWTNAVVRAENPLTINLTHSATIVAHFKPDSTVLAVGDGPSALAFAPIQPNPSPGGARLQFLLPQRARVSLAIFDASGRILRKLADCELAPGFGGTGVCGRLLGGTQGRWLPPEPAVRASAVKPPPFAAQAKPATRLSRPRRAQPPPGQIATALSPHSRGGSAPRAAPRRAPLDHHDRRQDERGAEPPAQHETLPAQCERKHQREHRLEREQQGDAPRG